MGAGWELGSRRQRLGKLIPVQLKPVRGGETAADRVMIEIVQATMKLVVVLLARIALILARTATVATPLIGR